MKNLWILPLLVFLPFLLTAQIYIENATPNNSNNKNVGVRLSNPEAILDVNQPLPSTADYGAGLRIRSATSSTPNLLSGTGPANVMEALTYEVPFFGSPTFHPLFILNQDGNVGIGTDQLVYRLNIEDKNNALLRLKSKHQTNGSTAIFGAVSSNGKKETQIQYEKEFGLYDQATSSFQFKILDNGNVGIGTGAPQDRLHVAGKMIIEGHIDGRRNNNVLAISANNWSTGGGSIELYDDNHQNRPGRVNIIAGNGNGSNNTNGIEFLNYTGSAYQSNMFIKNNGKIGIGTNNTPSQTANGDNISAYRLYVKGGLLTEEVRVLTGWADYVFDQGYDLKPLTEVESFIEENGHLPNMPPAKTIEENGLALGAMTVKQQEKIEELYLHLIRLEKDLKAVKAENKALKEQIIGQAIDE